MSTTNIKGQKSASHSNQPVDHVAAFTAVTNNIPSLTAASNNLSNESTNIRNTCNAITSGREHKFNSSHVDSALMSHLQSTESVFSASKKVLTRRDRAVLQPGDRSYFYTKHAVESPSILVMPSSTGSNPKEFSQFIRSNVNTNNRARILLPGQGPSYPLSTPKLPLEKSYLSRQLASTNFNQTTATLSIRPTASTELEVTEDQGSAKSTPWLESPPKRITAWEVYCNIITFPFFKPVLRMMGLVRPEQQKAWREKIGMLSIILYLTVFVGFFTFGFGSSVCNNTLPRMHFSSIPHDAVVIRGVTFNISRFSHHPPIPQLHQIVRTSQVHGKKKITFSLSPGSHTTLLDYAGGKDASLLFQPHLTDKSSCNGLISYSNNSHHIVDPPELAQYYPCVALNLDGTFVSPLAPDQRYKRFSSKVPSFSIEFRDSCHLSPSPKNNYYALPKIKDVYYSWKDIDATNRPIVVYLSHVIDLSRLKLLKNVVLQEPLQSIMTNAAKIKGQDISALISANSQSQQAGNCLIELAKIGVIESESVGCITAHIVLYLSMAFIVLIMLVKFVFALYFEWFMSWRLGDGFQNLPFLTTTSTLKRACSSISTTVRKMRCPILKDYNNNRCRPVIGENITPNYEPKRAFALENEPFYTLLLVTCYSESQAGIRNTLDSLATCTYPNDHKLIIVICDGLITGSENQKSTPEIVLSMMERLIVPENETLLQSYVAVATGGRRYNTAKAYAGFYKYDDSTVPRAQQVDIPMVCIVKYGDTWERETEGIKPGNRGKRDSQVLLMAFLQKLMFNERMCDLENYMYLLIWQLVGRDVMEYETILMVDADTKIQPDSLGHLVKCMMKDSDIMGLCGETQIINKWESWVTMIQVFEYFISHHLTKSFESVFGGVTCLPGCFSLYRIKAQKGPRGYWVPILVNPDIVERYGENEVTSLHKKNLLLLGEDRYLSTLMLKTFPTRKQIFIPQAKCKTIVPSEFRVLLDQRRRWINSTVHNLLELVVVRDLCGVFCLSMQCVILIELLGTLTLPAALAFTVYMLVRAIVVRPVPLFPLLMLALIIGLPGLLILVTAHEWKYVLWMFIYLLSLPVWNFVLPLNAFWKFDDFRWGTTRLITTEAGNLRQDQVQSAERDEEHADFDKSRVCKMNFKVWMETHISCAEFGPPAPSAPGSS
jgi:chitin synthase